MLAAGVAVTSVIGLSAASVASAATKPDATPACGFNCFNLFNNRFFRPFGYSLTE